MSKLGKVLKTFSGNFQGATPATKETLAVKFSSTTLTILDLYQMNRRESNGRVMDKKPAGF